MSLIFEWNERKAESNLQRHGVSFPEAATAFGDSLSITIDDPEHFQDEDRFILLGRTIRDRIVVVVHTERGDNIRIISARRATRRETSTYEHG